VEEPTGIGFVESLQHSIRPQSSVTSLYGEGSEFSAFYIRKLLSPKV